MLIAITGGIGSGKSVVSQLLRVMGFPVYDCDRRAQWVMTHDPLLRQQLISLFGPDTYLPASSADALPQLNKPYLSSCIFSHPEARAQMNACVHPAVCRDLFHNLKTSKPHNLLFFESAILFESGFDQLSHPDQVWTVSAPLELRITRAMSRDHATREQILARIHAQLPQEEKEKRSDFVIINDSEHSVIRQCEKIVTDCFKTPPPLSSHPACSC